MWFDGFGSFGIGRHGGVEGWECVEVLDGQLVDESIDGGGGYIHAIVTRVIVVL